MGLYKRGRTWWMSFSYKGNQIRRSTETSDKKLAERIYAKVVNQIAEDKWFERMPGADKTFAELAEKYEAEVFRESKSWKSAQGYLNQLKGFFGPYALAEITPALINEFKRMRKTHGVQPATIVRQLNIFKRMLNLAKKRWQWIREVPEIEMEPNADKKRIRYLSFEEYHRLLDCCAKWLKDIVITAAWTGMRQGNILNLKRTQVSLFTKTIVLDGSETKNGANLIIPITDIAFAVLKEAMQVAHINSPYVFCKSDGRPYKKADIQDAFKNTIRTAGIEDFRFHDLRHCFASWNRQSGVDIDTLADLMGHKDTRMTRRYAHISPSHLANAVGLLEKSYKNFSTKLSQSDKKEVSHDS